MNKLIWVLVLLLVLLHQDNWNWDNRELIAGLLPVGLAYHVVLSLACAVVWWLATRYAWPEGLDRLADEHREEHL
jgi:hypothetical protein